MAFKRNKLLSLQYLMFVFCISIIILCREIDSQQQENHEDSEVLLPNETHVINAVLTLRKLINKEFGKLKTKFEELNSKIDSLKNEQQKSTTILNDAMGKIDMIEEKMAIIDNKLESANEGHLVLKKDQLNSILLMHDTIEKTENIKTMVVELNTKVESLNGNSAILTEKVELLLLNPTTINSINGEIQEMANSSGESFHVLNKSMDNMSTKMLLLNENHLKLISSVDDGTGKIESIKKELTKLNRNVVSIEEEILTLKTDKHSQITSLLGDAIKKMENSDKKLTKLSRNVVFIEEEIVTLASEKHSKITSLLDDAIEKMENSDKKLDVVVKSKIEPIYQTTELLTNITSNNKILITNTLNKMVRFEKTFEKLDYVTTQIQHFVVGLGQHNNSFKCPVNDSKLQIKNDKLENTILLEHEIVHGINKLINCGGSVVAEKGTILLSNNELESKKCIWTVRANRKSKVTFYMEANVTNNAVTNSFITLTPYQISPNSSNSSSTESKNIGNSKILLMDTKRYEVDGPLVFVTLHWEANNGNHDQAIFKLHFFGSSQSNNEAVKYSHYHFAQNSGLVKYPFYGEKYQPNQLATFVINPSIYSNFSITLQYLNIEVESRCQYDSLSVLHETTSNNRTSPEHYYTTFGPNESDYRYCGLLNETKQVIQPKESTSAYIIIFKSDGTVNFDGFKFFWNV